MSIEAYEQLVAAKELYAKLQRGLDDAHAGRAVSAESFVMHVQERRMHSGGL